MDERYARLRTVVARLTPDQLRTFAASLEDPADVALLEEVVGDMAAEAERTSDAVVHWRSDPASMACHFEPQTYQPHPYFLHLGRKFRELAEGTDPFQIWMVPAQHGKSACASIYGPAWLLDRDPTAKILSVTYGDDLADRNGLAVRDILDAHSDVLRARLRRDQRRKDRFLTAEGGGVLNAGMFTIGGGWSAQVVVIDDPYKGWEQAHSAAQREKVWNIIRSVVWLRQSTDNFRVLLCTTRWHQSDAAAMLVAAADLGIHFTVTRLAEIAEAPDPDSPDPTLRLPDPIGRKPGELLGRFSAEAVRTKHALLGSYLTAALAQQRPAPAEGTEILREWFQLEETLPAHPDQAIASWDLKAKDKEAGDYVVGQLWWRVGGGYWLLDQFRGQWNNATVKVAMALMKVRHPEVGIQYFENAGNAPELTAELRRGDAEYVVQPEVADKLGMTEAEREAVQELLRHGLSSLVPVNPKGQKSVRMRAVSPVIEGRNVHLPAGAPWLAHYLDEMAAFPNGANDDQCLVAGTEVLTPAGPVAIESVQAGDVVLGRSGWVGVLAAGCTGRQAVESRLGLTATSRHPIATTRGWVPFHWVRSTDTLWTCVVPPGVIVQPWLLDSVCVATSGDGEPGRAPRSVLRRPTDVLSLGALGAASSCGDGAISTTPDGDDWATLWPFRNARQSESRFRSGTAAPIGATPTPPTSHTLGTSHAGPDSCIGTFGQTHSAPSLRDGRFTTRTGTWPTTVLRTLKRCHEDSTPLSIPSEGPSLVALPPNWRTWTGSGRLLPLGTALPKAVNGIASTPSGSADVYNLTTTDGTYYASGILVHNCDTTSQALSKLARPPSSTETAGQSAPAVPVRSSAVPGGGTPNGGRTTVMVPGVSRR